MSVWDINVWDIDWRNFGTERCSVYVVAAEGRWPCKIGIAVYPAKRLSTIQTSHWKKMELVRAVWCHNAQEARAVEQKAHTILREDHRGLMGEWFDRSPEQCLDVINFAAIALGIEVFDTVPDDARQYMEEKRRRIMLRDHFKRHEAIEREVNDIF